MYFTYCKFKGQKKFSAYDINEGVPVANKIFCTLVENTAYNQKKLQELADLNSDNGLIVQLREGNGRVVFTTKSKPSTVNS